jgi:hypothetical protein
MHVQRDKISYLTPQFRDILLHILICLYYMFQGLALYLLLREQSSYGTEHVINKFYKPGT